MSIKANLKESMKQAMKAKEQVKLDAIRMLLSALQYEEMQKGVDELSDEDTLGVLKREMKKRKEEVEFAEKAARADILEKLKIEMAVIEAFLPAQLSEAQIEEIISGMKVADAALNLGAAMKALKEQYAGQYDSKLASDVARKVLG